MRRLLGFIKRAWRGEERLWKVWWLLGLPVNSVCEILARGVELISGPDSPTSLFLAFSVLCLTLAWCNMVWACAHNVKIRRKYIWHRVWGYIAKGMVITECATF